MGQTIAELLHEAEQIRSPKHLAKEAGASAPASSIDEVVEFLISEGRSDLSKEAQAALNDQLPTTEQELIEKVAESVITLETIMDLSLSNMRDALLKEAAATGKTEAEVDALIEKVGAAQKKGLGKAMKFALMGLGAGASAAAGAAFGYRKGRADEFKDVARALSTPHAGEGDM